jgi:hypothetical protein
MKWAFSDESTRGQTFVMVAVVVDTGDVNRCRAEMRSLLRPRQRQLHLAKESRQRRDAILGTVGSLPVELLVVRASLVATSVRAARAALVDRLATELVARGVAQWILDAIDLEEQLRDRQVIARRVEDGDMAYDHRDTHGDPMLWVADAGAWLASGGRSAATLAFVDLP